MIVLILALSFSSCFLKTKKVPKDVLNLIPKNILDEMKEAGFAFYLGEKPPIVNGYYTFEPINLYDNSSKFNVGDIALTTYFQFENQIGQDLDVYIKNWTAVGSLDSSRASIIKGEGNYFTLIAQAHGTSPSGDKKYIYDYVISGEKTPNGIKDVQMGFVMIENPDIENVAKTGTIRIFNDNIASSSN